MQPRAAALLWDVLTAVQRIQGFVAARSWDDYANDILLRSAVERQFEIAGEAMSVRAALGWAIDTPSPIWVLQQENPAGVRRLTKIRCGLPMSWTSPQPLWHPLSMSMLAGRVTGTFTVRGHVDMCCMCCA